jgi:hypothetical protein
MLKFILFLRSISWTAVLSVALLVAALITLFVDPANNPFAALILVVGANVLATLSSKE